MVRSVRMLIIGLSALLVLSAMQIDVSAKKKSSKRKIRRVPSVRVFVMPTVRQSVPVSVASTAKPSAPVIVSSPVLTAMREEGSVSNTAAQQVSSASGSTGDGIGDGDENTKRSWKTVMPRIIGGGLIISEFRVRGPNGANDEFIELYNNSGADHTVAGWRHRLRALQPRTAWRAASIPNGTVIPNRGHYLCVNRVGYSLASYPAGNGTTATGDATYTTDIPDNAGIAIFNTIGGRELLRSLTALMLSARPVRPTPFTRKAPATPL